VASPNAKKEAFSRVLIDEQLREARWNLNDGISVRYEYQLPDGTFADYVLCDRHGRALAVIEAKRSRLSARAGERQGRAYAEQLKDVPYVFLANGEEILFWDYRAEAHPRKVAGFFNQIDLERRHAKRKLRVDPLTKPIDLKIVERDYQHECIDTLCREMGTGRRKLLVEIRAVQCSLSLWRTVISLLLRKRQRNI
jgi:type I restriction enzyme, R subunit